MAGLGDGILLTSVAVFATGRRPPQDPRTYPHGAPDDMAHPLGGGFRIARSGEALVFNPVSWQTHLLNEPAIRIP
jgi:hypothetical protein